MVTDTVYDTVDLNGKSYLAYEYLPGQYDQRADSAMQCLMLLNNKQSVRIHSGTLLVFENVTEDQLPKIEKYLINPVEARVKDLAVLEDELDITVEDVPVMEGFTTLDVAALSDLREELGLADAIFDIVSSGSTLVSNNLREVETVIKSEALLIGNRNMSDEKRDILKELLFRIKAVRSAEDKKYVLMNAPREKLDDIISVLPGIKSPTVMPLADENWCSVHTVLEEKRFWEIIGQLKEKGAQGILVVPIEKMIL